LIVSLHRSVARREPKHQAGNKTDHMSINSSDHSITRRLAALLLVAAVIAIDENVVKDVQEASDRSTRYGILPKTLDVGKAVDRSFTAATAGSNEA
jgi:hypothetical protein